MMMLEGQPAHSPFRLERLAARLGGVRIEEARWLYLLDLTEALGGDQHADLAGILELDQPAASPEGSQARISHHPSRIKSGTGSTAAADPSAVARAAPSAGLDPSTGSG
ncbi:MAG TPA: hypothetical protein PKZ76_14825, partial [Xanthomonadaceae bacterium]|nr:hypothetical protein [Xanthomonadaceae bacterium]